MSKSMYEMDETELEAFIAQQEHTVAKLKYERSGSSEYRLEAIEQVMTGAKPAAQLGCAKEYLNDVLSAVRDEGCEAVIEEREHGRVAVWIFRIPFVRILIEQMSQKATPPTASEVWAMGKLFGYSNSVLSED